MNNSGNNSGFSLIEFVVYLGLFSFVAMLFFGVASQAQFRFIQNSYKHKFLLEQELAVDLLRRDLLSVGSLWSDWDVGAGVFKKLTLTDKNLPERKDICWFVGAGGLMRSSGQYDFEKHEWTSRSSCIVCKSIIRINFVLQKSDQDESLSGVWVVFSTMEPGQAKKFFVKFRNRVVV